MSEWKYPILKLTLLITLGATLGFAAGPEKENGDSPFKGNRRPGILAAPTDEPTGENALLYKRVGRMMPNEYLDFLSED